MKNKLYLLALNRIPGIGPRTVMQWLVRWPDLAELFALSPQAMVAAGIRENLAQAIHTFDQKKVTADLHWEQQAPDHNLLTWEDDRYPSLLRQIFAPPLVIYAQGDLSCLTSCTIAMVGTRKPSLSGAETAKRFAGELAAQDITIVSGLALGIDACAHQGCLDVGGKTIAVLGTGIDCIYPMRHRRLAENISEKGLLISEFPLKSAPTAGHFPRRNRIISGLSVAILVVEAAIRSGSLITARLALEQNRDVWAVPGSIHNPQARGCHHLLQQGAKLITSVQDMLEELGLTNQIEKRTVKQQSIASNNKNLVKCIGFELTTIDQVIMRSGLSIEEVACNLAELEIQGLVKAVTGGYMRCDNER